MSTRNTLIGTFLRAHNWNPNDRVPLAHDASFRRYDRLIDGSRSVILMDAPPPQEDVRQFVTIADHLTKMGYSAPKIFAEDPANGLLLIEDLGDDTYTRVLIHNQEQEVHLYTLAVDLLIDLHRRPPSETLSINLPLYDLGLMNKELLLLLDFYLPAVTGNITSRLIRNSYLDAWRRSLAYVTAQPPTLVLRDFHVDNLIWLKARKGIQACGLLDFQDAVIGPALYDLMSLLEDARRDVPPKLLKAMLNHYFTAFPDMNPDRYEAVFSILAAQRHAKVIGIFSRLNTRDAKSEYLTHIPRLWRLLEAKLAHPALKVVADWFEKHIPFSLRITPEKRSRLS